MYTLTDLTKTYRGRGSTPVTALSSVSLTIPDGEFVSIQGPTGGGKSTLLQLLGALDRPSSGSLTLGGHNIAEAQEKELTRLRASEIGFVFQNFNLIPTLTASENVQTALVPHGVDRRERAQRASEALDSVGLADRADHLPSELSGGQQQRVAIARALVARPTVLLADEPTGNLDEHTRDDIMALLESQWRERDLTMIMVTHDSAVAARAQRRLRLAGGTVTDITPAAARA